MLVEKYSYTPTHVTSTDFVTYPLLRFKDAPQVTPIVIQWSSRPFTAGVGEPVAMAVGAAAANAFFDATGVRMRTAPFTPARARAYLKQAGWRSKQVRVQMRGPGNGPSHLVRSRISGLPLPERIPLTAGRRWEVGYEAISRGSRRRFCRLRRSGRDLQAR